MKAEIVYANIMGRTMRCEVVKSKLTKAMLAESHRRQFHGEDYQKVAVEIALEHGIEPESDDYQKLESAPDPDDCKCGFCKTADWQD